VTKFLITKLCFCHIASHAFGIRAGDRNSCLSAPDALDGYSGVILGVTERPVITFSLSYCLINGLDLYDGDRSIVAKDMQRNASFVTHTSAG
jgi:hypothetical protein